jgi:(p)ppGpp synthase/HD superfamily hydrolase
MAKSGRNPKPVVLHSVRTGLLLHELGYPKEVVTSGFLHDIIEDSSVTAPKLRKAFGADVCRIVKAGSDDAGISDRLERSRATLRKIVAAGKKALIVSAADRIENLPFFGLGGPSPLDGYLRTKTREFLAASRPLIGKEPVWKRLARESAHFLGGK